jgi:hypothetical protein
VDNFWPFVERRFSRLLVITLEAEGGDIVENHPPTAYRSLFSKKAPRYSPACSGSACPQFFLPEVPRWARVLREGVGKAFQEAGQLIHKVIHRCE